MGETRGAGTTGTRTAEAIEAAVGEKTGDGEGIVAGNSSGMTETETGGMAVDISLGPEAPTRATTPIIDHNMIATDCSTFLVLIIS